MRHIYFYKKGRLKWMQQIATTEAHNRDFYLMVIRMMQAKGNARNINWFTADRHVHISFEHRQELKFKRVQT